MATSKKKPSAAQLAARKLFAQRAKAGTLKKTTKRKPAAKRATNPARKTVKSKKADMLQRANSVSGAKQVTIYVVESSKDRKRWGFLKAHFTASAAKDTAEDMAAEYPELYWRVSSEVVK